MAPSDIREGDACRQLKAWYQSIGGAQMPADILISDRDANCPFVHLSSPSLDRVPLLPLDTRLIEACCRDRKSRTVDDDSINIDKFKFEPLDPDNWVPYPVQVANAFALGLIQLLNKHWGWSDMEESPFLRIKSVPECIVFDPEDWKDVEDDDYRPNEEQLYQGIRDAQGWIQSRGVGMIYGGLLCYGCVLGTRLPSNMQRVPEGKILRSELWALLLTMIGSWRDDPGPCMILSFTSFRVRVITARFRRSHKSQESPRLSVQVMLDEPFITDMEGSYHPEIFWELLGWSFFRRMKRATRRSKKKSDEDGWISEDYDERGNWLDTEA